uniref:uncharacterized protein LOC120347098 n=1 Tax=Styela clava TaxID=7725 RepID=UPI00193A77A0|nr:uncharacterized protein LOC120347098 [Styela clava]
MASAGQKDAEYSLDEEMCSLDIGKKTGSPSQLGESYDTEDCLEQTYQMKGNAKDNLIRDLERKTDSMKESVAKLQKENSIDSKLAKAAFQANFGNFHKASKWLGFVVANEKVMLVKRLATLFDRQIEIFLKRATVLKLVDQLGETIAKAAVQANPTLDVDSCMDWAEKNKLNEGSITSLSEEYDQNLSMLMKIYQVKILVTKYGMSATEAKASVYQTKGNIKECMKWVRSNKENYGAVGIYSKLFEHEIEDKLIGQIFLTSEPETSPSLNKKSMEDLQMHRSQKDVSQPANIGQGFVPKMSQSKTVGTDGGVITIGGNKIHIPPGALKKEIHLDITLNHETDNVSDIGVPITPILSCVPHVEFDKPVKVGLSTCFSAIGSDKISAIVFGRKDVDSEWKETQKLRLGRKNYLEFEVLHFSDDVIAVSEEDCELGEIHLINDVFIEKDTEYVASFFFIDFTFYEKTRENLRDRNIVQILMSEREIITKMGAKISLRIDCKHPQSTAMTSCGNQTVQVTPSFLKKRKHVVYFTFDPELGGYKGRINMRYYTRVEGEEEEVSPLGTSWPIVVKRDSPNIHFTYDASTKTTANVIATEGGTANVSSKNPVYKAG